MTHVIIDGIPTKNALDTHVHKPDDVPLAVTSVVVDPEKRRKFDGHMTKINLNISSYN